MKIDPKDTNISLFHSFMVASIAPRPIAFASTMDKNGLPNLAPFSFFNAFGSKPPIVAFSPARSVRNNTNKHTLENIYDTKEVVINVVNYNMVEQTSLASAEYPKEVNEFTKAGFTPIPSERIKPFRVKESPVQMECKVVEVKEMGFEGGAANLVICEILLMHVDDGILDQDGKIDPNKIGLVGRMGGNFYARAYGDALFEVQKPNKKLGVGFDNIPQSILHSKILSGNDLGKLGNVESIPSREQVELSVEGMKVNELKKSLENKPDKFEHEVHVMAKDLLNNGAVMEAWRVLLAFYYDGE